VDSVCINSGTAAASDQQVLLMTISLSLLLFALSNRLPPLFVGFREGQAPSRTSLQQVSSRAAASLCCLIKLTSMDLQML